MSLGFAFFKFQLDAGLAPGVVKYFYSYVKKKMGEAHAWPQFSEISWP